METGNELKRKVELGPIQEAWICSLEQNPKRQMLGALGRKFSDGSYKACILGEGGLIAGVCEWSNAGHLRVKYNCHMNQSGGALRGTAYEALGLFSHLGMFDDNSGSLTEMNDSGISWPEIAAFIRANPEKVFVKSV